MLDVLTLISTTRTVDAYGGMTIVETTRQVFRRQESIGQTEFYQAAASGLKPELKLILADYLDYQGEKVVQYNGQRYHVLRTYRKGQELELTCYTAVNETVTPPPTPPTTPEPEEEGGDE